MGFASSAHPAGNAAARRRTPLALILATVLGAAGVFAFPITAYAATTTIDGIVYEFDGGNPSAGATVKQYVGTATEVTIPDSIDIAGTSYPVTAIGSGAFVFKSLTSVVLPTPLQTIGSMAFYGNELSAISLPPTLLTIQSGAFEDNEISSVEFPASLLTIESDAFGGNVIGEITLPQSLTSLGAGAFRDNALETVTLLSPLTEIPDRVFSENLLTEISIPDTVTTIGNGAFSDNLLSTVHIPHQVEYISYYAFADNPLTSVFFEGAAAPALQAAGQAGSFGLPAGKVLYHDSSATGFTSPLFYGYTVKALYGVTFDAAGGSTVAAQTVAEGESVLEPVVPVRDGYTFAGWYVDPASPEAFYDFASPVTGDLVLHASWVLNEYGVTFESGGGSAVEAQTVPHGDSAAEPVVPVRDGYAFAGWYVDPASPQVFYDFASPVTEDLVLYASWVKEEAPVGPAPPPTSQVTAAENKLPVTGGEAYGYAFAVGSLVLLAGAGMLLSRRRASNEEL